VNKGEAWALVEVHNPQLWWPVGHGKQPLYNFTASILQAEGNGQKSILLDTETLRIGLREIKVVQRALKDQDGTSFFFQVNGKGIFCGGSNWIPADNFLTRITKEKYRKWLELMTNGNQNMVRAGEPALSGPFEALTLLSFPNS
jgi:beta-mannosidase